MLKGSFFTPADSGYGEKGYKSSTKKMALSLILVVAVLSEVVLTILSSTIVYVYLQRRKLAEGEGNKQPFFIFRK